MKSLILFFSLVVLLKDSLAQEWRGFALSSRYRYNTQHIAFADMNNDGKIDLIRSGSQSVTVLLGNGSGQFSHLASWNVGKRHQQLATADLDADGNTDLLVSDYDQNCFYIFYGLGDGLTTAGYKYTLGGHARHLAVADFNDDGILDILAVHLGSNQPIHVYQFFGNGTRNFPTPVVIATEEPASRELKLADFNKDGKIDVFFSLSSIAAGFILYCKSDGTLSSPVYMAPFHENEISMGATIADFNKDGILDWAYARFGDFALRIGTPEGKFHLVDSIPNTSPFDIEAADIDLDGVYDLFYAHNDSLSYSLHNGSTPFTKFIALHQSPRIPKFVSVDINKDRFMDIVSFDTDSIFVYLNLGNSLQSPEEPQKPIAFELEQNFPNPFNPSTTIRYKIEGSTFLTLEVFDMLGKKVATLANEFKPAGSYEVQFQARGLASGLYFYRLKAGSFQESKKMLLLK
ncbi:MAG: FG-GAP-like repeat-containing protein [Chloroherpetonaceae bacterium]|nr:FG-GAP-like repeat-containing protein [Chloroherpetonaceae bacterium]